MLARRAKEDTVVDPLRLDELELSAEMGPEEGEHDAPIGAVVLQDTVGQQRAVAGAAADHAVQAGLAENGRVARVHTPGMRPERTLEAAWIVGLVQARAVLGSNLPHELARVMHRAWVTFIKSGSPQHSDLPEWPAYEPTRRAAMELDIQSRVIDDPDGDERRLWDGVRVE